MKVFWLQDLDVFSFGGGAQETDKMMIYKGLKRGYDIELILPEHQKLLTSDYITDEDLVIISNCVNFNIQNLNKLISKKYIVFHHDYWFCKYRGYFPMQEKCKKCLNKPFWENLFLNARLNVFLSPLHYKMYEYVMPNLKRVTKLITPSPIDTRKFKIIKGIKRKKNTVLYVGALTNYKGFPNLIQYAESHPQYDYTFIGVATEKEISLLENKGYKYIAPLHNNSLPKIYNSFEYVIHLPQNPLPFERSPIVEGVLCGCKAIFNKNVGASSYPWFKKKTIIKINIEKSPTRFWETIEKVINRLKLRRRK